MLFGFGDMASVGTDKRDVSVDCHCLINAVIHGRIATFGIAVLADFGRQLPVVKRWFMQTKTGFIMDI